MEQLCVVFSKSTSPVGLFSKLIMLSERIPYSHVAVCMVDDDTKQMVYYQASHTMVNAMSAAEFLMQEDVIYSFVFQVDRDIKIAAKEFAIANLGKAYGALTVLGLAMVQMASWLGVRIRNPFKKNGATYVCDQFVATMLSKIDGVKFDKDINDLTPKDVYPVVAALPKVWRSR